MVPRSCPVCGSVDDSNIFAEANVDLSRLDRFAYSSRKFPELMHFRLVQCPQCDLLYANPAPAPYTVVEAYREAAFDTPIESEYASMTYGKILRELVENMPHRAGALDIGTGDGSFLEQLIVNGFSNIVGIEPSDAPVAAAKEGIRPLIRNAPFESQEFEAGSFSLVTCLQTLEHMYNPVEVCRRSFRMLREGGAIFIVSHNYRSLSARLLGLKSPIFDIEHLQLFSPKSALYLLKHAGFVDLKIRTVFNSYPLHYWTKLLPLPARFKSVLVSFLQKARIGRFLICLPAGNLAVIGYKRIT